HENGRSDAPTPRTPPPCADCCDADATPNAARRADDPSVPCALAQQHRCCTKQQRDPWFDLAPSLAPWPRHLHHPGATELATVRPVDDGSSGLNRTGAGCRPMAI